MAMPKIEDVRALSDVDLDKEILAVKKELFELRLQVVTKQLTQPHLIRLAKHRLGQLLTVESERKLGIERTHKASEA
jgi:large subunit ribosomal protein L29